MTYDLGQSARLLTKACLIALAYAIPAIEVPYFASQYGIASLSWPSSGIALACLLIFGEKYWPAVFVGAVTSLYWNDQNLQSALIVATGLTLEPLLGAWLLKRYSGFSLGLMTYRSYFDLMLLGAIVSPCASTLFDALAFIAAGGVTADPWPAKLFRWWMDSATGIMLVTPTILIWRRLPTEWFGTYQRTLEVIIIIGISFLVGGIVFNDWLQGSFGTINRGYWLYLFITWAAIRLGTHGVILLLWLAAWQGLVGAISGTGFFAHDISATQLCNFWFYTAIISTVGMSIATILAERRRSEDAFRDSLQRYNDMARRIPVGTYTIRGQRDGTLAFDYVSPRLCELLGVEAEAVLQDAGVAYRSAHPEDIDSLMRSSDQAVANQHALRWEGRMIVRGETRWFRIESDPTPLPNGDCLWNGVISDITDRKKLDSDLVAAKEEAEDARQRAEAILSLAGQGICGVDQQGRLTFINSTATDMLGWSAPEVLGLRQHDLLHHTKADGSPYSADECPIYGTIKTGTRHHVRDEVFWRKDGSSFPVEYISAALTDGNKVTGAVLAFHDISEQRAREAVLREAREAADIANQMKSRFLATMSHEIRTPITSVMGMIDLLRLTKLDDEQRSYIQTIGSSTDALLTVLNDILDISKIEAGRLTLEEIEFDLPRSVRSVFELCQSTASGKGLILSLKGLNTIPDRVMGDPVRLKQILHNLISNGIKFTEKGSVSVALSTKPTADNMTLVVVEIRDTGIGMSPTQMARLFQPFSQADASTTRRFGGTGLGLTITRRLVELKGGEIDVESRLGEGTCFRVTLPMKTIRSCAPAPEPSAIGPQPADAVRPLRILLAEDNAINQRLVATMLRKFGHRVTTVWNGREAVTAVEEGDFEVVLMDMQMPEMDGAEATQAIRAMPAPRSLIPVIALTADVMAGDRVRYFECGITDLVGKPVDWPALSATLEACTKPPDGA